MKPLSNPRASDRLKGPSAAIKELLISTVVERTKNFLVEPVIFENIVVSLLVIRALPMLHQS